MKTLTEEQAWKALQVVFSTRAGFCRALEYLEQVGLISNAVKEGMSIRFSKLPNIPLDDNSGQLYFKFPVTLAEEDPARMLFAQRQAELSRRRKTR